MKKHHCEPFVQHLLLLQMAIVQTSVTNNLLVVLSPALASAFVVDHHSPELALMFAGLLPHDGSAGGGGAAWHGCCVGVDGEQY